MTLPSVSTLDQWKNGFSGVVSAAKEDAEDQPSMAEVAKKILEEQEKLERSHQEVRENCDSHADPSAEALTLFTGQHQRWIR